MDSFVEAEIIAREARIDPLLDAARASYRLIAIGQALALAGTDRNGGLAALDLLIEGAALCSVAATTEQFAATRYASEARGCRVRHFWHPTADGKFAAIERCLSSAEARTGSSSIDSMRAAV